MTVKEKLDKLARLENPHKYWRTKYGSSARYCVHQGCNECIHTAGIVKEGHCFAGPTNPNTCPHLDQQEA